MRGMRPAGPDHRRVLFVSSWVVALRDAAIVVAGCAMLSLVLNGVRKNGLPLVQEDDYQILVPCPETTGEAAEISPDAPLLQDPRVLIIDARSAQDYGKWHVARAINIPFDYLEPTSREVVNRTASSGAQKVVVYGDGNEPDSGEQLARELSGKGIRNVHFVVGGAPAVMAAEAQEAAP